LKPLLPFPGAFFRRNCPGSGGCVAAGHDQIRDSEQHRHAPPVLVQPPVPNLRMLETVLQPPERMLEPGPHRRLAPLLGFPRPVFARHLPLAPPHCDLPVNLKPFVLRAITRPLATGVSSTGTMPVPGRSRTLPARPRVGRLKTHSRTRDRRPQAPLLHEFQTTRVGRKQSPAPGRPSPARAWVRG